MSKYSIATHVCQTSANFVNGASTRCAGTGCGSLTNRRRAPRGQSRAMPKRLSEGAFATQPSARDDIQGITLGLLTSKHNSRHAQNAERWSSLLDAGHRQQYGGCGSRLGRMSSTLSIARPAQWHRAGHFWRSMIATQACLGRGAEGSSGRGLTITHSIDWSIGSHL